MWKRSRVRPAVWEKHSPAPHKRGRGVNLKPASDMRCEAARQGWRWHSSTVAGRETRGNVITAPNRRQAGRMSSLGDTMSDDPKENRPSSHHSAGGISGFAVFGCCLGYSASPVTGDEWKHVPRLKRNEGKRAPFKGYCASFPTVNIPPLSSFPLQAWALRHELRSQHERGKVPPA